MNEKKFDRFMVVIFIISAIAMIFHSYFSKRLIFAKVYIPIIIYFSGTILGLFFIFLIRKFIFKINTSLKTFFTDYIVLIKSLFLSALVFGNISSWTFDYFNMNYVKDEEVLFEKCKVYNIILKSAAGTHNSIGYKFNGETQSLDNFSSTKLMDSVFESKDYDKCYLYLYYKQGLLTSYVIEDYSFVVEGK